MLITTETLLQNIFLASIILMALSLPKIFILFFWSHYRLWVFEKIHKISKKSVIGKSLRRILPESFLNTFSNEDQLMGAISQEVLSTVADLKIPMIEAISSVLLMIICIVFLNFDSPSIVIIALMIALLFISIIIGAFYIKKYYVRAKPFIEKHMKIDDKK